LPRATPASGVDAARGRAADGARRSRPSTPPPPPRGVVPTEPETETYLEIEADLPPESGVDADFESELALSIALSGDIGAIESVRESVSVTIDDDNMRVTETVTETDALTLTVTVAEPITDRDAIRKRAITAQDSSSVSGTISIPDEDGAPPARRAKRHSEGWDE
jgi:hypothetical protein